MKETYQDLEEIYFNNPIKILNYDLDLVNDFKNAFQKGIIDTNMLRNALDKGEITLKEYIKIVQN